ncbi:hypothetical protein [Atrimonas thermophila]|uniref:hypothetical protein n=1 Tax=Atrimonas thermophila TaxID=3064161 RepID=UPI00399CB1D7
MLKVLCLGWVTDSLKVILALKGAGFETVVVNTSPTRFFERVPGLHDDIPVANLYQGVRIPNLKFLRFLLTVHPHILGSSLLRKLSFLLQENGVDFVFAHRGVGVLPEIALVKSINPDIPVILNMETFPTTSSAGLRKVVEQKILKKMSWFLGGLIIPTDEMATFLFKLAPFLKEKSIG